MMEHRERRSVEKVNNSESEGGKIRKDGGFIDPYYFGSFAVCKGAVFISELTKEANNHIQKTDPML